MLELPFILFPHVFCRIIYYNVRTKQRTDDFLVIRTSINLYYHAIKYKQNTFIKERWIWCINYSNKIWRRQWKLQIVKNNIWCCPSFKWNLFCFHHGFPEWLFFCCLFFVCSRWWMNSSPLNNILIEIFHFEGIKRGWPFHTHGGECGSYDTLPSQHAERLTPLLTCYLLLIGQQWHETLLPTSQTFLIKFLTKSEPATYWTTRNLRHISIKNMFSQWSPWHIRRVQGALLYYSRETCVEGDGLRH